MNLIQQTKQYQSVCKAYSIWRAPSVQRTLFIYLSLSSLSLLCDSYFFYSLFTSSFWFLAFFPHNCSPFPPLMAMENFRSSLLLFFLVLFLSSLLSSQQIQALRYLDLVEDATELPQEEEYDYIVVGGGTAGCALAATLSENYRVLVLERGGHALEHPSTLSQDGFLTNLAQANEHDSAAENFISLDGVTNVRGRILGGSSAINAGFYSRADEEFLDYLWDQERVNKSYEWVEKALVFHPELTRWQSAVREGLLEAGVWPYNAFDLDHAVGTKVGGSTFDQMGRRHTAAELLNYAQPDNIIVAIRATVERIIIVSPSHSDHSFNSYKRRVNGTAAIGVVYRDQKGHSHHAMLRDKGEVILCAGAIGSPQLLLLSGVGSVGRLSPWDIPVVHHLESVGAYMYDNPRNDISFLMPPLSVDHSLIQVVGITDKGTYIEAASNIVSVPVTASPRRNFRRNPSHSSVPRTVATIMEKISGPLSVGWLKLASADVKASPVVKFNYFQNVEDLARCVRGMRKIGEVLKGRAMERYKRGYGAGDFNYLGDRLPENQLDDGLMGEFCKNTVKTIWHYHGGCVVGKVVDPVHRVIGVDKLRVVDGSTFRQSPGTNPQATVMMLGRYMGLEILAEREKDGEVISTDRLSTGN